MRGPWLSIYVAVAFALRIWSASFVGDSPVPGWEWALAGFLCGGNLGLWAGRYNGERNERERAAMQPQLDYMRARYATDDEAREAGQRVRQKHAKSLKRLADFSEAERESARYQGDK